MRGPGPPLLIEVGALTIAVREAGAGDPVFLINGTGESSDTFAGLMGRLEGWRGVAADCRDTGRSSRVDEPYTPADLAADAAGVIHAMGLGACHVLGFSLGGAVAQELAIARPELVRSLALLSTWARSDAWFVSQMRSWQALRRAFGEDSGGFDRALEPWMFSPATMRDPALLADIHRMWDTAPDQPAEAFVRQCEADIAHDAAGRLGLVRRPALVVVGADDICTPPRYARELCSLLPDARLQVVADAGHCALFERPDEVAGIVWSFLDELGS